MDPVEEPGSAVRLKQVLRRPLHEDDNLVESLAALVDGCVAASITIVERGRASTVAATDDRALAIDQTQYDEDGGPCLHAARTIQPVVIGAMDGTTSWPGFEREATRHGVHCSLSVPMGLAGMTAGGALNLYGERAHGFGEQQRQLASVFALQASAVVVNALAYWAAFEQSRQLTIAMSRATIEQAKGILMASQGCGPDEAFDLLRRASQRENRKLRDLAAEIVARARTPCDEQER